jgi:hypothetical protein
MAKRLIKRTSRSILQSLAAGVVPRSGTEHIVVGREDELTAIKKDFDEISADGGATFRLIVGRYGSGKSFLMQMLRNEAMASKFVVADADLSPQRRLTGSKGEGLSLYRELLNNMATRNRPNGNAFAGLLEKWIDETQSQIRKAGIEPSSSSFDAIVETRIGDTVDEMQGMVHGFDFAEVIKAYMRGHQSGDDQLQSAALRWLRGEFSTKTEARRALNVRVIIDDGSWYDYVKLLAFFVRQIGYRGLVIFIDEAVYLSRISNRTARHNNFERLLNIYNDTLQGGAEYLGVLLGATSQMVEDNRRGLFSYEALQTRLEESRFARQGLRDLSAPMIRLDPLSDKQLFFLLETIRDIHAWHNKYESHLGERQLRAFLSEEQGRIGADKLLTPREVLRDYVTLLNLLLQHPRESFESILGMVDFTTGNTTDPDLIDSPYASFEI